VSVDQETTSTGFELLKYILLFGSIPLWGPFAKALWDEFLLALRADGGLNGLEPNPRERREIEERIATEEDFSQVHEPIAHLRGAPTGSSAPGRRTAPGRPDSSQRAAGPRADGQRRTFHRAGSEPTAASNRPRFR